MRIRHIATRLALILATAAVLPLVAYGVLSIASFERGARESVMAGNVNVAARAAEEIRRYVASHAKILKALGETLQVAGLDRTQQEEILRNYVLDFGEFGEVTLFDEAGHMLASSRVGLPRVSIPADRAIQMDGVFMSPVRLDEDGLPTTEFAVHLIRLNEPVGWLVGEIGLEEMWRMVDRIRIGERGFALVITSDGRLVAHGDPDKKAVVAQALNMSSHPLVNAGASSPRMSEYTDGDGEEQLAAGARIEPLGWTVIVEQPTAEAYANATALQRELTIAVALALLITIASGLVFGRRFIAPIFDLRRATQAVAAGHLDTRVDIKTGDEFSDLGNAFNGMANRLAELHENVRRQERQAMFGRLAAGLVHDLSHPIQNIGNNTRLLLRADTDPESRANFHRTIERELATLKHFMDDLRHVVRPKPVERFPMDVNASVAEIVDAMSGEAELGGVTILPQYADERLFIGGDRFALGRVYRNLLSNAIQATGPGGRVSISIARAGTDVQIVVADTGAGIPADRLPAIFDDFVTTKRRGLGLGLAISKRIVEQLEGTISVESEVGRGTSFTLRFPVCDQRALVAS
jgi:signal transduction histidine kinase